MRIRKHKRKEKKKKKKEEKNCANKQNMMAEATEVGRITGSSEPTIPKGSLFITLFVLKNNANNEQTMT